VKIPSLLAKQARNDTILGMPGVLIQLFENPQGTYVFLVFVYKIQITFK